LAVLYPRCLVLVHLSEQIHLSEHLFSKSLPLLLGSTITSFTNCPAKYVNSSPISSMCTWPLNENNQRYVGTCSNCRDGKTNMYHKFRSLHYTVVYCFQNRLLTQCLDCYSIYVSGCSSLHFGYGIQLPCFIFHFRKLAGSCTHVSNSVEMI